MRTRLVIGTLIVTLAVVAALFVPAAVALANAEGEAQIVELQSEAADAAARVAPGGYEDHDVVPDGDDRYSGQGRRHPDSEIDLHSFGVYSPSGLLIEGEGPARLEDAVSSALSGRSNSARIGDVEVVAVPLVGGGALRAAESTTEVDKRISAAVFRLGLSALLVLLGGAVAAWLLARRLTRPLGQLRTAATRLGAGDFTATAPTTGVAEIDDVADALNASATRIGSLVERERRLSADTAHQLRTPITGLRLALEGELADPRPDRTDVLYEALGAVDRLEATVTGLSALVHDAPTGVPFDVADVARTVSGHWAGLFASAHRALDVQVDEVTSTARRVAVETILDVLLDNALTHGTGTVVVHGEAAGGAIRVTVADEGTCELTDDRLFARHESAGGSTGIGLDLARTLASAEGARLRLVSAAPTVFELLIPGGLTQR